MVEVDILQELDLELVWCVQYGESVVFDVLVCKYQYWVVVLVGCYIVDWSECQDVVQDIFICVYCVIGSFCGDVQFLIWLY